METTVEYRITVKLKDGTKRKIRCKDFQVYQGTETVTFECQMDINKFDERRVNFTTCKLTLEHDMIDTVKVKRIKYCGTSVV